MLNLIQENHYTCLIKPTKELSACREIRAAMFIGARLWEGAKDSDRDLDVNILRSGLDPSITSGSSMMSLKLIFRYQWVIKPLDRGLINGQKIKKKPELQEKKNQ